MARRVRALRCASRGVVAHTSIIRRRERVKLLLSRGVPAQQLYGLAVPELDALLEEVDACATRSRAKGTTIRERTHARVSLARASRALRVLSRVLQQLVYLTYRLLV